MILYDGHWYTGLVRRPSTYGILPTQYYWFTITGTLFRNAPSWTNSTVDLAVGVSVAVSIIIPNFPHNKSHGGHGGNGNTTWWLLAADEVSTTATALPRRQGLAASVRRLSPCEATPSPIHPGLVCWACVCMECSHVGAAAQAHSSIAPQPWGLPGSSAAPWSGSVHGVSVRVARVQGCAGVHA